MERSMWPPTATFLSVAGSVARRFIASARAMRRSGTRRRLLIRLPQSTWAVASFSAAQSILAGFADNCSWRLIARAVLRTTTFTCWPACGPPGGNGTDVMFARSTNGGVSFSAPQRINDDPVNPSKWHWFGTVSVAPNGRLDAVWYDTRNAANNTDSQLFYSYSTDGGVTWAPNVAVSNPFNPFEGYPNQSKIGDYI